MHLKTKRIILLLLFSLSITQLLISGDIQDEYPNIEVSVSKAQLHRMNYIFGDKNFEDVGKIIKESFISSLKKYDPSKITNLNGSDTASINSSVTVLCFFDLF